MILLAKLLASPHAAPLPPRSFAALGFSFGREKFRYFQHRHDKALRLGVGVEGTKGLELIEISLNIFRQI